MSALDRLFGRGTVTYHRAVAEAVGSVASAIFAEQIAFWQEKGEDGWAFRSVDQIFDYTGLKKDAQQGARNALKNAGVLEEEHRGMPARNYYRINLERLSNMIAGIPPPDGGIPPTSEREPANRSIEGVESKDISPTECTGGPVEVNPVPIEKYYVTLFYDRMKAERHVSLRANQFGFHVKQMERMLKQYEPSDEEVERVVSRMVEVFPSQPKVDALSAIQDVRLGRDTGEAWSGPAPWQKEGARERSFYDKKYHLDEDPQKRKQEQEEMDKLIRQAMENN